MIYIELGYKKYPLKDIGDLNYKDYNIVIDMLNSKELDDYLKIKNILKVLSDIPNPFLIKNESLNQIDYSEILKKPILEYKKEYRNHKLLDFENMTFGHYIDLDSMEDEISIATLCLLDDYDMKTFNKLKIEVENYPVKYIFAINDAYYKWKQQWIKKYEILFDSLPEDLDEEELEEYNKNKKDKGNQWLPIVYELANNILNVNKITKLKIIEVFNYLTYQKIKTEEEKRLQKSKNYI